jgi:cystathionine beta-synthase
VVNTEGKPIGIIHEVDVLRGLHSNTIAMGTASGEIMNPIGGLLHPKARVEELYGIFETDHVAIVIDGSDIQGVVSKIDLIEHLAKNNQN